MNLGDYISGWCEHLQEKVNGPFDPLGYPQHAPRTPRTDGSTVLRELTRDLRKTLSLLCVAKDSEFGEGCQVYIFTVIVHVFSWPPVNLRHERGGVGKSGSTIRSPLRSLAA